MYLHCKRRHLRNNKRITEGIMEPNNSARHSRHLYNNQRGTTGIYTNVCAFQKSFVEDIGASQKVIAQWFVLHRRHFTLWSARQRGHLFEIYRQIMCPIQITRIDYKNKCVVCVYCFLLNLLHDQTDSWDIYVLMVFTANLVPCHLIATLTYWLLTLWYFGLEHYRLSYYYINRIGKHITTTLCATCTYQLDLWYY